MNKILKKKKDFFEFIGFAIVGSINTFISLLIYYILVKYLKFNYLFSSATSYFMGIFIGFILNSFFVFKKNIEIYYGIKYFIVYISSLFINILLLFLLVNFLYLDKFIGQIVTTLIVLIYNFILSKKWTYK